jgi:hypothetical protein
MGDRFVGANPTGVTTFLAEDRKALLGVLGFFLGFSLGWIFVLEGGCESHSECKLLISVALSSVNITH